MGELFDAIKAASKNGKLHMFGTEWTMVLTNAIGELMVRLKSEEERKKVYESGKASALDAIGSGFGSGSWMPKMLKNLGVKAAMEFGKKDFLIGNIEMWGLLGWGNLKIIKLEKDEAIFRIDDSPIASYVLKKHGKQDHPVCDWIMGEFAGGYSYLIGKDVNGTETKCVAMGDAYCEFEVKPVKK